MEAHLDLVGGMAGDMFVAALLDAYPNHEARVLEAVHALNDRYPVACSLRDHDDHSLRGRQFLVRRIMCSDAARAPLAGVHGADGHSTGAHGHSTWASIRSKLLSAALAPGVREHAVGIFSLLAEAEAHVHGVEPDAVEFHEVGAWDSVADIVGAAALIDALGATRWSASAAPLGAGRVTTAHGVLPVPAPATARLLIGLPTVDDGVPGERVTPTGAAILRYLCPPSDPASVHTAAARTLSATGVGFGTRVLPGLSNHVRVLCFEPIAATPLEQRRIEVLNFEVDDQSGEDLAVGLERIRARSGVLDLTHSAVLGKKGRLAVHVQVLARPSELDAVVDACFRETTTIGLRHHAVTGIRLKRNMATARVQDHALRVKLALRPGGMTAKAESDDVLAHDCHARRASFRARAEHAALNSEATTDA